MTEYTLRLKEETDRAWGVSEEEYGYECFFLPKSQCEVIKPPFSIRTHLYITLDIPDWLALKSGLA